MLEGKHLRKNHRNDVSICPCARKSLRFSVYSQSASETRYLQIEMHVEALGMAN